MGVPEQEIEVGRSAVNVKKISQVADKDALELGSIAAATRGLARFAQHPAAIDQCGERGVGYRFSPGEVAGVTGNLVQIREGAEDDPLVVSPGGLAVILAGIVQAVVD